MPIDCDSVKLIHQCVDYKATAHKALFHPVSLIYVGFLLLEHAVHRVHFGTFISPFFFILFYIFFLTFLFLFYYYYYSSLFYFVFFNYLHPTIKSSLCGLDTRVSSSQRNCT